MKKESLDFALKLKQKTLDLLNSMDSKIGEFDLPETPETYKNIVIELKENVFRAAVLGEAKRGKSSFINALLGKKILPVEEEIATSKAFLISNSETESFFIRFMDESYEEIKEEQINLVGSQKEENEGEEINFFDGKNIKWIEINLTYKNLPKYITLIDTPGLGAL
jgi:ribosome biogenesis GTPase A